MESLAQAIAGRVAEIVVQALDLNEIIGQIDLSAALDQVDVNHLLDRVDVDRLLEQVDVNRLVGRVDVNAIMQRVDVGALIDRVDVNGLAGRLDVDALVGQTDLGSIIAKSTSGVASEALDVLRSQTVMIDQFTDRVVWRLERREGPRPRTPSVPAPPGEAEQWPRPDAVAGTPLSHDSHAHPGGGGARARTREATWTSLQGHYAGGASRLAAWIIDAAASTGAFTLALAAISYAATVITGHTVTYSKANWIVAVAYTLWLFAYFAYPWSLSGKSLGMAVLGVRVVAEDGTHAGGRRAVIRTLALPLSFLLFGLGLAGIVVQRQNRALHDFIAGTAVVYSWDARAARIRFLARPADAEAVRRQGE